MLYWGSRKLPGVAEHSKSWLGQGTLEKAGVWHSIAEPAGNSADNSRWRTEPGALKASVVTGGIHKSH